jgi:hypothetical protein
VRSVVRRWAGHQAPSFSFELWVAGYRTYVGLPHPSGRCRVWNEEESLECARRFLRQAAPNRPWGTSDERVE